jgi:hypothetical protein
MPESAVHLVSSLQLPALAAAQLKVVGMMTLIPDWVALTEEMVSETVTD